MTRKGTGKHGTNVPQEMRTSFLARLKPFSDFSATQKENVIKKLRTITDRHQTATAHHANPSHHPPIITSSTTTQRTAKVTTEFLYFHRDLSFVIVSFIHFIIRLNHNPHFHQILNNSQFERSYSYYRIFPVYSIALDTTTSPH
jgi:hypothetical protein